jgi:formiminoglutamase
LGRVTGPDLRWPSAASLLRSDPVEQRRNVALLGVPTRATALSPRSEASTPAAVRAALERYSTYSWLDATDLAGEVNVVDHGDVVDPDGPEGIRRVAEAIGRVDERCELVIALGGDNAATFAVMTALAGSDLGAWGLVTVDAHLDLRDGVSNGSPVRQLLEAGLPGSRVAQIGLADFSNSAFYAGRAADAGITVVPRSAFRELGATRVVAEALAVAGAGDGPVYVDLDMDVADRSVVPACPAAAPGGLSADEVRQVARLFGADPRVRAIDVTEIDVARDADDERTVRLAALVVLEALAGTTRRPR